MTKEERFQRAVRRAREAAAHQVPGNYIGFLNGSHMWETEGEPIGAWENVSRETEPEAKEKPTHGT